MIAIPVARKCPKENARSLKMIVVITVIIHGHMTLVVGVELFGFLIKRNLYSQEKRYPSMKKRVENKFRLLHNLQAAERSDIIKAFVNTGTMEPEQAAYLVRRFEALIQVIVDKNTLINRKDP